MGISLEGLLPPAFVFCWSLAVHLIRSLMDCGGKTSDFSGLSRGQMV